MSDFWANRRAAVAREEKAEQVALDAQRQLEAEEAIADKSDEELLEELGLPDPAHMDAESDFKAFLKETVPARLRTRALRQLWRVNPVLANLDGLIDYGEDYTDAATVIENLQTTYQVGKGMFAHVEEMARQAEAEEAEENAPAEPADDEALALVEEGPMPDDTPDDKPDNAPEQSEINEDDTAVAATELHDDTEALHMPRHRRMTFTFEEKRAG